MRTKFVRVGILAAALLGLFGATMTPAQATTVATATFVGNAETPAGLGYPCTPVPDPACVPPDKTEGRTSGFRFNSTACVGEKADVNKPKGTGVYGPLCVISAEGFVTGYCGLSLGFGAGTVTWFPLQTKTVTFTFTFKSAGGTLVVEGESAKGTITAVVEAVPTTGSCTDNSATGFTIAGEAAIANPTVVPGTV